jgi:hypothetical protein
MLNILRAYLVERVPVAIFGPAIALLTLAAVWTAGAVHSAQTWIVGATLTALLLVQFRLWDDVEDRERDRVDHPHRLVVRSGAAPFRVWIGLLAAISMLASFAAGGVSTIAGVLALDATAFAAYRVARARVAPGVWVYGILLAKYPAFVMVAASALGELRADRAAFAALVTYLAACLYEAVHTSRGTAGVHP